METTIETTGKKHNSKTALVAVSGTTTPEVAEAETLRDEARGYYAGMQRSWFFFAKTIQRIRVTESFKLFGSTNLKEFCEREYPNLNYTTVVKTLRVVEAWGDVIEDRLKKDTNYVLPAYESCYQLSNAESKLPTDDYKRLKRLVLDGKISFHSMREQVKQVISRSNGTEVNARSAEDLESELLSDIKTDINDRDVDLDEEIQVSSSDITKMIAPMQLRVEHLNDSLPTLTEMLKASGTLTDEVVDFAYALKEMCEKADAYMELVEALN